MVRSLDRRSTIEKIVKPSDSRLTLVIPFDKRLPNISSILHHRWQCLLARESEAKVYMSKPPRVAYTRTKSLRDILIRSKLPPPAYRQERRQASFGFKKCGKGCSVCAHSCNTMTIPVFSIKQGTH